MINCSMLNKVLEGSLDLRKVAGVLKALGSVGKTTGKVVWKAGKFIGKHPALGIMGGIGLLSIPAWHKGLETNIARAAPSTTPERFGTSFWRR